MHDVGIRKEIRADRGIKKLTKANECIARARSLGLPPIIFDQFWREGELALLFGPAAAGKSVLAVQIADAVARGRPMDGFVMPAKGQRVLLVDLKLSERQFMARYSSKTRSGGDLRSFKCSENLYRERPVDTDKLCEWLRETVAEKRIRVVVIDDLSEIRNSCDGTKETLMLMRELRQLKDELDISILVITGSREAGRSRLIAESDLGRSRVLCDTADSVFALGMHRHHGKRYLIQTRSRGSQIYWDESNSPTCSIVRFDDGLLGFQFDDRFAPEIDREFGLLVCKVRSMHDRGSTYREIAEELKISMSKATRLYKKWTPALEQRVGFVQPEEAPPDTAAESDNGSENGFPVARYQDVCSDNYLASIGLRPVCQEEPETAAASDSDSENVSGSDQNDSPNRDAGDKGEPGEDQKYGRTYLPSPDQVTVQHTIDPMSSLKRSFDNNGREIFIEKEDARGKAVIFYRYYPDGRLSRFVREGFGNVGNPVDGPACWFNSS